MQISLETPGARLRLLDSGVAADGRALVFLHYWGGSAATWRKVVAILRGDMRCIAISQRGWGGSIATDGRYDLEAMADDVVAVVRGLGLSRVVLVGHSMGGKVAQIVAARRLAELAGLVLVAPAPPGPLPVPEEVRTAMLESYRSEQGIEQALAILAGPALPATDRAGIVADTLGGVAEAKREWVEHGMLADLGIAAGDITVPTTVVTGNLDQVEPLGRLKPIFAKTIPHAEIIEIEGAGHLLPLEMPDAVAAACVPLLRSK